MCDLCSVILKSAKSIHDSHEFFALIVESLLLVPDIEGKFTNHKLQVTNRKFLLPTFLGAHHELPCLEVLGTGGDYPQEDQC